MTIEERIDYIVKNDNNLTLDEEINLLLDVYNTVDDKEYEKIDVTRLSNTKLSFEENKFEFLGDDLSELCVLLLNALGKNISQNDILDYIYNGIKSSKIIELIERFEKIFDAEEFKSEVIVLLYCESDEAKKEIIFDEKKLSELKLDSDDIVYIISSMESDEAKKEIIFDGKKLPELRLYSYNIVRIISSMKSDEAKKEIIFDEKKLFELMLNIYDIARIISSMESDKAKKEIIFDEKKLSELKLNSDYIADIIFSMKDEAKKESLLNEIVKSKLDSYKIAKIISSMKSDEAKKEIIFDGRKLSELMLNSYRIPGIISSMKSDEAKKEIIFDEKMVSKLNLNPSDIADIISSMKSDEAKKESLLNEKVISKLDSYNIARIISSMKSDEAKKEIILNEEMISKLNSDYIAYIISSMKDEAKKKIIFDEEMISKLSSSDIFNIISSMKDEAKKEIIFDEEMISKLDSYGIARIISSMRDAVKVECLLNRDVRKKINKYYFINIINDIDKQYLTGELAFSLRCINSDSIEISNLGMEMLYPLFNSGASEEEIMEKIEKLENIFLRNNIPFFGKIFLCFGELYPNLSKIEGKKERFDFSDDNRMSPQLQDDAILRMMFKNENKLKEVKKIMGGDNEELKQKIIMTMNKIRFGIIFNELLRIAINSNNRSLNEYLDELEKGNKLFESVKTDEEYNELSDNDKKVLEIFLEHLKVLYENRKDSEKVVFDNNNIISQIQKYKEYFKLTNRYNLLDRLVRSFCYYGGYKSYNELRKAIDDAVKMANSKGIANAEEIAKESLKLEVGDFIRCIGGISSLGSINDGNVCKEFLGSIIGKSESDTTPLDIDWTRFLNKDIGNNIDETLTHTPTGFDFGNIFFIIKGNKENPNYVISRIGDNKFDYKYDPKKIEMFNTGYDNHYGSRVGVAIGDIDYILINEHYIPKNGRNYKGFEYDLSALKNELVKTGIYVPIVNMQGKLIFDIVEFRKLNNKLSGLKTYNRPNYPLSLLNFESINVQFNNKDIYIPDVMEIVGEIKDFDEVRAQDEKIVRSRVEEIIKDVTDCKMINDHVTGDLTRGIYELLGTGSTVRGTCIPGDADYDYVLRIDNNDLDKIPELMSKLENELKPQQIVSGRSNRFRAKGVNLGGKLYDIDITFIGKTNKLEYYTEEALSERLDAIKEQHPDEYDKVRANIVLAKKVFKSVEAYKSSHSVPAQGGLGGVGIENWILQNNGSFVQAMDEFLSYAIVDNQVVPFSEFKKSYHLWDAGSNHEASIYDYSFDEFINNNLNEIGYMKMCNVLLSIKNSLDNKKEMGQFKVK